MSRGGIISALRDPSRLSSWARIQTITERNAVLAIWILLGCFGFFGLLYGLEMDLGRWNREIRLVRSISESATRYVATSHFLMAFLFLATSMRMRAARPWGTFVLQLALAACLCFGWDRLRGMDYFLAQLVFFGYFLLHDFRDQVFFYVTNGDAPPSAARKGVAEALFLVALLPVLAVTAVFASARAAGLDYQGFGPSASTLPAALRWVFLLLPVPILAAGLHLRRLWRREGLGDLRDFVRAHRPLFHVFAISLSVLAAGIVVTGHVYGIVVLHVTSWYVFALRQIQKRRSTARPARTFSWGWMRSTPAGFTFLHIFATAVLVVAGVGWAYAFQNDASVMAFRVFIGPDIFPLWTIAHVTVSFASR